MDNLPQELVDAICKYLERDDLKNVLLLSPKFQEAAEQYCGEFSTYALTEDNADEFMKTYSGRHIRYLRTIEFRTSVPALENDDDEHWSCRDSCRDSADELREMDEEFTRQIRFLFSTLHELEQKETVEGRTGFELQIYTPTRAMDTDDWCLHRMFTSWRVHLISPETLPNISLISTLSIENGGSGSYLWNEPDPPVRKLDLRVLLDISAKLPSLQTLKCAIGGDEWAIGLDGEGYQCVKDWPGPRRDSRHDFAMVVQTMKLGKLRDAELDFIYPVENADAIDQRLPMPNLVKPALYDPFSSSLRLLSYQLRTMRLRVVADETLFWPADGSIPSWPNLERLCVTFHIASPSGAWYFKGHRDVGAETGFEIDQSSYPPLTTTMEDQMAEGDLYGPDSGLQLEEHRVDAQYRLEPNNEVLVPFLTSFARAAASMPSLKSAELMASLSFNATDVREFDGFDCSKVAMFPDCEIAWAVSYAKPRIHWVSPSAGWTFSDVRQIAWSVGKWRPDDELLEMFKQIGSREHGEGLSINWGDGLLDPRDDFGDWEMIQYGPPHLR